MKKFEQTLEEIAALAEKNLEDVEERTKTEKTAIAKAALFWAAHLIKDCFFQLSVRLFNQRIKRSFPKYSFSEKEVRAVANSLKTFVENTEQFVDAGEAFADDYSRELLVKFFAMRLGIISDINPARYISSTELALTRGDYLTWYLSLRKIIGGWKVLGFVFRGAPIEPPGVLYLHGVRERDVIPSKDSVFVDVGAYIGDSALPMSCYFGKVLAFEPYEPNLRWLRENTKGAENVEIIPCALGDREGNINMETDVKGASGTARVVESEKGTIRVTTMDKALKDVDLGTYGVIKMDIEGYERKALKGGRKIIKEQLPQLVISAYHLPDDIPALVKIIEGLSDEYSLYFRHHKRWAPTEFVIIARDQSLPRT